MMQREDKERKALERAQATYDTAFHSLFLRIIHGSVKSEEGKKIPASVAKDVAKGKASEFINGMSQPEVKSLIKNIKGSFK